MKGHDYQQALSALYVKWAGEEPSQIVALAGAGSDRRYYRIYPSDEGKPFVIGCAGPDVTENVCFVQLSDVFRTHDARVPQVYALSDDCKTYLQQDLGDVSLFGMLADMTEDELESRMEQVWRALITVQQVPVEEWEDGVMHAPFSERQAHWDLNYFKYEYLRVSGVTYDEEALEDDFDRVARALVSIDRRYWGFMYRDCQSRNVMICGDRPWLIDFQGGRLGPCLYDAVSMLCQARAPFSEEFRDRMVRRYAEMYCSALEGSAAAGADPDEMLASWPLLRVFRCLQVLGAYGLRGLVERRAHFVRSIPGALRQLGFLVEQGYLDSWPELRRVCSKLASDSRFATTGPASESKEDGGCRLTVHVFSFSYMKGYPADYSGNGGGFMFDCRAMHNPGRYAEYKALTGRDRAVIDFLEERGEVKPFLQAAWMLVDPAIARYSKRGFESLQVGFGCTGGQHRSVYCAEKTAAHIRQTFPDVRVVLIHREQGIQE